MSEKRDFCVRLAHTFSLRLLWRYRPHMPKVPAQKPRMSAMRAPSVSQLALPYWAVEPAERMRLRAMPQRTCGGSVVRPWRERSKGSDWSHHVDDPCDEGDEGG
jgi:hypothetical protein